MTADPAVAARRRQALAASVAAGKMAADVAAEMLLDTLLGRR